MYVPDEEYHIGRLINIFITLESITPCTSELLIITSMIITINLLNVEGLLLKLKGKKWREIAKEY